MIPHSRPTLGAEEAKAAAETILSGQIAHGPKVAEFEKRFADFLGLQRAVAVNSGTSALHLALLALGTKPGDEVIVPDYVCTALLNAVHYTGAIPVIADVSEADGNLDCQAALRLITPKTRAVIVPHMFGTPCAGITLFKERGIPVIEDCAQSVGAELAGGKVGTLGDLSIFSFYATKVMTCGEGGMVASNRPELTDTVADLCDYDNRDDYLPRYNYKMTDFQAAMGLVQLARLPDFIQRRREIAQRYNAGLKDLPLRLPSAQADRQPIHFRYIVRLANPESLLNHLRNHGISAAHPVFKPYQLLTKANDCPISLRLWHESLSLPIYPLLQDAEVDRVIAIIRGHILHA
ncbi:MAG TPA: aminotransferase DegT [Desulfobulbaceae bacterium]|nr:MAG: hypothetical protein A2520_03110 [Deltaproteobacteria bacterium RIFOXYD12_FULL_53_23]HCC54239.1 aminotransferase DegT [Desulfobulbaceae bacterium]